MAHKTMQVVNQSTKSCTVYCLKQYFQSAAKYISEVLHVLDCLVDVLHNHIRDLIVHVLVENLDNVARYRQKILLQDFFTVCTLL